MADKKNVKRNSNQRANESEGLNSTVKGTIAIMLTLLIVIIVVMIFAKTLFFGNKNEEPKKTGTLNAISYVDPPATTAPPETTASEDSEDIDDDDDDYDSEESSSNAEKFSEITCTSPVYLHPQPNSSSANLDTIPAGAKVKYFKNENGWYYVEYNGQNGYAWQSFFTAPPAQ